MTAKQKKQRKQLLLLGLGLIGLFFAWVVIFMNFKITGNTAEFFVKQYEWTNKFVANLIEYHIVYLIFAAVLLVGYLFLSKKKK